MTVEHYREDAGVRLWDVATGRVARSFPAAGPGRVWRSGLSPDGKVLAVTYVEQPVSLEAGRPTVKLWDIASGKERDGLPGHWYDDAVMAFGPDGKTVAVATNDGTIQFRDAATWEVRREFPVPVRATALALGPDGRLFSGARRDRPGVGPPGRRGTLTRGTRISVTGSTGWIRASFRTDADLSPIRQPDDHGGPRLDQVLLARAQAPPFGRDQPGPIARWSNAPSPPRNAVDEEDPAGDPSEQEVRTAHAIVRAVAFRMHDRLPRSRDDPRRSVRGVEVLGAQPSLRPTTTGESGMSRSAYSVWLRAARGTEDQVVRGLPDRIDIPPRLEPSSRSARGCCGARVPPLFCTAGGASITES